jgi:hypothetical protein
MDLQADIDVPASDYSRSQKSVLSPGMSGLDRDEWRSSLLNSGKIPIEGYYEYFSLLELTNVCTAAPGRYEMRCRIWREQEGAPDSRRTRRVHKALAKWASWAGAVNEWPYSVWRPRRASKCL